MAKARATCTCERCGAAFYVEATRASRKSADEWEEWAAGNYTVCRECEAKEYAELAEKAAKQAQEDGLPALRGTERQVAWAEQIRQNKLVVLNALADELVEKGKPKAAQKAASVTEYIMHTKAAARWWIDNLDTTARRLVEENYEAAKEAEVVQLAQGAVQSGVTAEASAEDTVIHPENERYGTVNVVVSESKVEAHYPKDETFRGVVKAAGYEWDSVGRCWCKVITSTTGAAVDRAAELMNTMLDKGFAVDCKSAEAREKAISGTFEPECRRWVKLRTSGQYNGWLAIAIPRRGEDDAQMLYDAARRIKGSKWNSGSVVVPVAQWALVEDFAGIYGYRISDSATVAIKRHKDLVTVRATTPEKPQREDVLGNILTSSDAVLPELSDD